MYDFKLNYYFYKYKDHSLISITKFKSDFIKNEGKFDYLNELIIMIQKYQCKKYNSLVETGKYTFNDIPRETQTNRERSRVVNRFGTKEERIRRKLKELRK